MPNRDVQKDTYSAVSAYLAAASAAFVQTTGTHPLDTAAKRLQNHNSAKDFLPEAKNPIKKVYSILYPNPYDSLWSGYQAAVVYRVVASTATFGSQKQIQAYLMQEYGASISQVTGQQYQSVATHALAGVVFAPIDVLFLPFDRWKVLRQVNNTTPVLTLMQNEGRYVYTGSAVTCVRNCTSFPVMFGVSDWCQQSFLYQNTIPFYQRVISSSVGAVAAVVVSNPTDVVKTRMQAFSYSSFLGKPLSARVIAAEIYQSEGMRGFARGIVPRLLSIAPRLTFVKAVTEQLTPMVDSALSQMEHYSQK